MREYFSQFRGISPRKQYLKIHCSPICRILTFLTFMKRTSIYRFAQSGWYHDAFICGELTHRIFQMRLLHGVLASIRCFINFLMQNYHITVNPAKHIKLEKSPKKLPHFLNGAEIDLLLAQPNIAEPKGCCRDKSNFRIALLQQGIRATELVELNLGRR